MYGFVPYIKSLCKIWDRVWIRTACGNASLTPNSLETMSSILILYSGSPCRVSPTCHTVVLMENVKHIRDITEYDRGGLGIIA